MGKQSRLVFFLAVGILPALGWAFPFEVETQLNGVHLSVETMDLGDNLAAVSLHNYGEQDARCTVRFRGGPQARTRKATVAAQHRANVTASFSTQVIRMRVKVTCHPIKES